MIRNTLCRWTSKAHVVACIYNAPKNVLKHNKETSIFLTLHRVTKTIFTIKLNFWKNIFNIITKVWYCLQNKSIIRETQFENPFWLFLNDKWCEFFIIYRVYHSFIDVVHICMKRMHTHFFHRYIYTCTYIHAYVIADNNIAPLIMLTELFDFCV